MTKVFGSKDRALAECIDRIEKDNVSLEEALNRYPKLRGELEPLVRLAMELREMPKISAPAALRTTRRPVFARPSIIQGLPPAPRWGARLAMPALAMARPAMTLAAGVAVALVLTGGTVLASAGSLPEEMLYPVKLAAENAQLVLATDPQDRAQLQMQFATRRVEEARAAAQQGKTRAVERALELYESGVRNALQEPEGSRSAATAQTESKPQLGDSLDYQQEVLQKVYDQVPAQARAAILHAMDVSKRGKEQARGRQLAPPGLSPQNSPTTATPVPTSTASPDGEPTRGRDVPGKGQSDKDNPSGKAEGQRGEPPGKSEASDRGRAARAAVPLDPTSTPIPTATTVATLDSTPLSTRQPSAPSAATAHPAPDATAVPSATGDRPGAGRGRGARAEGTSVPDRDAIGSGRGRPKVQPSWPFDSSTLFASH